MKSKALLLTLLAANLAAGACRLSDKDKQVIKVWLLCDDCRNGERQRVAALGRKATPLLWAALRDGPPAEGRQRTTRQLHDLYKRLKLVTVTEADFISPYLDRYVNNYRVRAALSLGDIHTSGARAALQEAVTGDQNGTKPLPQPVRIAVYGAQAAALYSPFTGKLSDSSVAAFDTVTVKPGSVPWDGNETVTLPGGPFPGDLLVTQNNDSLRLLAVGTPGTYNLVIEKEGPNPVRAPLVITSLRYEPHTPASVPNLVVRPFPQRIFIALGRPPASDTVDYFGFSTIGAVPFSVTATATWQSNANVDLKWQDCVTAAPVGNLDGSTPANKPERTSVSVPAGQCWNLLVIIRGNPTALELIKLDLTSP